ncbi:endonuclease [Bacillus sp. KH172YL63]|uniref:endonuclease n=1 Tax=Bacillus sp. KH172YL63 TaxID=2709784 RepID=UPI0013E44FB6|nr:endonuclease [Bacillus sp. KH172YL63]BCB04327.1 hypothetical protein KH172YL63_24600 [Bacillus sp. KH172YL63]
MKFTKKHTTIILLLAMLISGCSMPASQESKPDKQLDTTASMLSVKEAIQQQDNRIQSVSGYIVGQPVSESNVLTKNFSADYSIAIADHPKEHDPQHMLYVQIPADFRYRFGLKSSPERLGEKISISGNLTDYYAHPGMKGLTDMSSSTPKASTIKEDPKEVQAYYQSATGKDGQELKKALHMIIDEHTELSYKDVWDALRTTDEDPSNPDHVILFYSRRSQFKYANGGEVDDWNREHIWAKSHGDFGARQGAGTDLHHIRPADVTINSSRSNLDFDIGGSTHPEAPGTRYDKDSWEAPDEVKGDIARMLFYMSVRYEGDDGEVDLELNERVENNSLPFHGKKSILLQWHQEDPVDASEKRRNNIIFEQYQGNRNPFIDHPEWVTLIWK